MSIPRTAVLLTILCALFGCETAERVIRPQLSGFVYDAENGNPLRGCQVGETSTDAKGYFMLPLKTSQDESFEGTKPHPLVVSEFIIFQGYEMVRLYSFKPWGVSDRSRSWDVQPIFLRRLDGDEKSEAEPPWREVSVFGPISDAQMDYPSPHPDH